MVAGGKKRIYKEKEPKEGGGIKEPAFRYEQYAEIQLVGGQKNTRRGESGGRRGKEIARRERNIWEKG